VSRWLRFYDDAINDVAIQRLSPREFRIALRDAMDGKQTPFSRFIKPGRDRPSGPIWQKLRSAVFSRDDYTCSYCGERGGRLECDHVQPVSRGGSNELDNLTTSCFSCNRSKRAKTPSEWKAA
jgi:5-methylcytosine-specific restriction endonuclease McrA